MMLGHIRHALALAMAALLTSLGPAPMAGAEETLVGSAVDSRVVLGLAVPQAAAQAMMPDGWKALTLPKGPLAGTNLVVVLSDRHLETGPDRKPGDPAVLRQVVLASYGVQPDAPAPRLYITRIYSDDTAHDPYGLVRAAAISRKHTLVGPAGAPATRSEEWAIAPAGGGEIILRFSHTAGTPVWTEGENRIYSAANPEFFRIYRFRQIDDLAMSEAMGKPLAGEIEVSVTVPELAAMFDGTERVTAVISRPVYTHDVYLP